jgi:hypothetical protein
MNLKIIYLCNYERQPPKFPFNLLIYVVMKYCIKYCLYICVYFNHYKNNKNIV